MSYDYRMPMNIEFFHDCQDEVNIFLKPITRQKKKKKRKKKQKQKQKREGLGPTQFWFNKIISPRVAPHQEIMVSSVQVLSVIAMAVGGIALPDCIERWDRWLDGYSCNQTEPRQAFTQQFRNVF